MVLGLMWCNISFAETVILRCEGVSIKKMEKGESNSEDAPMQDTGKAVVSPTQGDAPAKKVASAAKEISGDAQQKGEGAPDKMSKPKEAGKNQSLAAGYEAEGDENLSEMEHEGMHDKKEMANTTMLCNSVLSIPNNQWLTDAEVETVAETIRKFF